MKINLDDWQQEVLSYEGDILLCTGRRVGKTEIMAQKAIEYLKAHPGGQIIVVSLTEDQAQLIIAMALNYATENYKSWIGKGKFKPTQNKVYFNRGLMQARPVGTSGDAVRGFTGDVLIVDEASRMPDLMWIAARPILLTSGKAQIWMCSTPFGKQGFFWEKFKEANIDKSPEARFKVVYKSSEEVIRERPISSSWTESQRANGLKMLMQEKRDMTELEYGQEYMGLFLDDLRRFFDDDLLEKCCTARPEDAKQYARTYLGCDIARMGGDETTVEAVQRQGDILVHVGAIAKKRILTTETKRLIIEQSKVWRARKVGIDAGSGSLGVGIFDELRQTEIASKVIAMNNREIVTEEKDGQTKKQTFLGIDMFFKMRALMEQGKVKILNDPDVRASLASLQMEVPKPEEATKRIRIYGNYSHHAEGLKRAIFLADQDKGGELWVRYN